MRGLTRHLPRWLSPRRRPLQGLRALGAVGNELPSVALTRQFLVECEHQGSERMAVRLVVIGRNAGVPGLPADDDWSAWDAEEMRAVVDYLQQKRRR